MNNDPGMGDALKLSNLLAGFCGGCSDESGYQAAITMENTNTPNPPAPGM